MENTKSKIDQFNRNSTDYPLQVKNLLESVSVDDSDILQYHQKLIKHFFTSNPHSRGLLVFHGTGRGKTMLSVSLADMMKDDRRVVILSAKSLHDNFKKDVVKYMELLNHKQDDIERALDTDYNFISSNAGNMLTQFSRLNKTTAEREFEKTLEVFTNTIDLEGVLLIVDEAQNLFNSIVNGSKNATGLYRAIMEATDIKLIFLSATPIINDPFELVPIYNMLHGSILLPEDYDNFYDYYVDGNNSGVKNREKFKNRIFGMTSYMGDWWESGGITHPNEPIKRPNFPDQLPTIVEYVPMSTQQYVAYANARDIETRVTQKRVTTKETMQKPKSDPGSTYRVASRQISNFLLPDTIKIKKLDAYGFTKHIGRLTNEQLTNLDVYSPKMKKIISNMDKHSGIGVVYSSFVTGEGLKIFSMVLNANNWREYKPNATKKDGEKVYAFITGQVHPDTRSDVLKIFNNKKNMYGSDIDLLLLSGAGAEGLDLKNVTHIHLMEPYWNYGRIEQIIARAIRYMSHADYPDTEGSVQPYIYLSDYPTNFKHKPSKKAPEKTTDVHLYIKSIKSKLLIDKFYAAMIESSIDCSTHLQNSPQDVKDKINCVMCVPTHTNLFHPNNVIDLKLKNPCTRPTTKKITVEEYTYNDNKYYISRTPEGISIYEYNESLASHIEIFNDHPHYEGIIRDIHSQKNTD